jgi:hypothetical protein
MTPKRILVTGLTVIGLLGCSSPEGLETVDESPSESDWTRLLEVSRGQTIATLGRPAANEAVDIHGGGHYILRTRAALWKRRLSRVAFDIQMPDTAVSAGAVALRVHCPQLGIRGDLAGSVALEDLATGRPEIAHVELPESLQTALASGCDDLSLELEFDGPAAPETHTVGRLKLAPDVAVIERGSCDVPDPGPRGDEELPSKFLRRHEWRSGATVQDELARLSDVIEGTPGFLGLAADDVRNRFVVLLADASAHTLRDAQKTLSQMSPLINLAVQRACRSGATFDSAKGALDAWSQETGEEASFYFDADHTRIVAQLPAGHEQEAQALEQKFGGALLVRSVDGASHGRANDGEPHYGAANLENVYAGSECTAGFVVNGPNGKGAVTAGHCFEIGEPAYSGDQYYGLAQKKPADTTAWDMVYLAPDGETFSSKIHTTPCCPNVRNVVSKTAPVKTTPRQVVCISGRNFLAKCSVEVINMLATKTIDGKTRKNVWIGQRTGVNIAKEGDSGAPLYIPLSQDRASIVGMHIAGFVSAPFDQTWFHSVGDVESKLGVTVAF